MNSTSEHSPASEEEPLLMQEQTGVTTQQTGAIPKIKNPSVQKKDKITGKNKDEPGTHIDTKDTMSKDEQKSKSVLKIFRYFKSLKVKKFDRNTRNYKIVGNIDLVNEDIDLNKESAENYKIVGNVDLVNEDIDLNKESAENYNIVENADLVNEDIDLNEESAENAKFCETKHAEDLNDCLKFGGSDSGQEYQTRKNVLRNELKAEMNDLMAHRNNFWGLGIERERKIKNLERHRNLLFEPLPPLAELSEDESDLEENENATYPTKSGKLDQFDVTVENGGYKKVKGRNEPEETLSVNTNVKPDVSESLCQKCGGTALTNQIKNDLEPSRSGEPIFVDIPLYHYLHICGVFEKVDLEKHKKSVNSKEFNPNPFEIYIGRFLTIRKLCSNSHKTIWIAFDSTTCKFVFMEYYVQKDLKVNADELISSVEITVPSWECDLKILCELVTCFNILFDDHILRCIVRAPVDKDIFEEIGHMPASFDKTELKH